MKLYSLTAIIIICFISCHSGQNPKPLAKSDPNAVHKVLVDEVYQTKQYTILKVKENDAEQWIALPTIEAGKGETFYYIGGMEMKDFESKELNKKFASIIFLENISRQPIVPDKGSIKASEHGMMTTAEKKNVKVEKAKNGISIGDLFKNMNSYNNKEVIIRGQVTKFTPGVMDRNWFHLQDGSEFEGKFDLTANTKGEVKIGDIVTVKGKIALDKNIGAGFVYEILLEDAEVINN
jgi:hypothetical protein